VLANSPVVRSDRARLLFLASAIITAGIRLWAEYFLPQGGRGLLTPIFLYLFQDLDTVAGGWTLLILVLAAVLPRTFVGRGLLGWISNHMASVVVATAALLSAGTVLVYRNHPLAMDEYAPYFQSQVFAAGHLTGHFPEQLMDWLVPPRFQNYFFSVSKATGAVASGYWPSFALLLTPFMAFGIPWVCNPLISALTLYVAYRLALRIYKNRETAALVVLLTAASPEFFVNGISYYSMPAHLLANALFALLLLGETPGKAWLAGVVGSVALTLHNPLPHILFAVPWLFWIAGRRNGFKLLFSLVAGYLPLSLLLGFGWFWFTGHLRHAGLPASTGGGDLASMWGNLAVFELPDASVWLARIAGVAKIWLWAVPGLMILAVVGAWKGRRNPLLRLFAFSALLTLLGFIFVPVDQGHGWGYRYFHTAWIALPLLAAAALTNGEAGDGTRGFADEYSRAFVIRCAVLMLLIGGTVRAVQVHEFLTRDLSQIPKYNGTERRIVLLSSEYAFYGADLVQNDPWLRGDVVRMFSHGREQDSAMMAREFPQLHQVYADRYGAVWSTAAVIHRASKAREP
jgi:hypothetical protein